VAHIVSTVKPCEVLHRMANILTMN